MKVRIVLNPINAGWIIGKMGKRLCHSLNALGVVTDISDKPDPEADVNHWMSYAFADGCHGSINTMMITHVDDYYKVKQIGSRLKGDIDLGICMSPDMCNRLFDMGVEKNSLWYVLPGFDKCNTPPRINIGIATRLYEDGRKREVLLEQLCGDMLLDDFQFSIYGSDWDRMIPILEGAGASVNYYPGTDNAGDNYDNILKGLRDADYYLYMGLDEGALGTLDAIAAGARILTTPQGFHLNLPKELMRYFLDYSELKAIFQELSAIRQARMRVVNSWTWHSYAKEHLMIWEVLAAQGRSCISGALLSLGRYADESTKDAENRDISNIERRQLVRNSLRFRSIRGAIARSRVMQPLRRMLKI